MLGCATARYPKAFSPAGVSTRQCEWRNGRQACGSQPTSSWVNNESAEETPSTIEDISRWFSLKAVNTRVSFTIRNRVRVQVPTTMQVPRIMQKQKQEKYKLYNPPES